MFSQENLDEGFVPSHTLPWEVEVLPEDGYKYVVLTIAFCVVFQVIARQITLFIVGTNSPKRGVAPRIATKLVSIVFDLVAVMGGIKELLAPQASVILDPIYGYSSHSQFHFSVAAGYFAWAAVVTLLYKGSNIAILHHTICSVVYLLALTPFMHHIGNIYLLFQASTLVLDCYSCGKLFTRKTTDTNKTLLYTHPLVFIGVRIGIGLPVSFYFIRDMINLLVEGEAKSVPVTVFFLFSNVLINVLNVYWATGMAFRGYGKSSVKPICSVTSDDHSGDTKVEVGIKWFDIMLTVSFGERDHGNAAIVASGAKTVKTVGANDKPTTNKKSAAPKSSIPSFTVPVAIVAVCSVITKSLQSSFDKNPTSFDATDLSKVNGTANLSQVASSFLEELKSLDISYLQTPVLMLLSTFVGFKLFSKFGTKIYDEACKHDKHGYLHIKIRNQWYDLAKFDHPGGPVALNLAKDRDATALFESHHYLIPSKKLYGILNKYKLSDEEVKKRDVKTIDPRDDGAHYEWEGYENDPFTLGIKEIVVEHFTKIAEERGISLREATKATPARWFMILSMMAMFFATVPSFLGGEWWTLVATPLLAWVVICNYWHDGLHFSLSTDWRINAVLPYLFPWLSSPWMWYHQHVIGHHAYTNVDHKDPDLAHAPQLMREHKSIKWRKNHAKQETWVVFGFVWSVAVGLGLQVLSDIRANTRGAYNNVVPYAKLEPARLYAHIIGRMFYVFILFVWPYLAFPFWKGFIFATVPITLFSWYFMINSQINHLTTETAHASDPHFLKHQVITAQDFGAQNAWCTFFSGGLNMQIEHHMFPCVNHCHLPALQPKVKALCLKHGVAYNEVSGYKEAFRTHIEHTTAMGVRPFSVGQEH